MSQHELTEEKLYHIAKEFEIDLDKLREFLHEFELFYEEVRQQHLASIMRALELRVRKKNKKPDFKIVWASMPKDSTKTTDAVGLQWPTKYAIAVPPELDLQHLRDYVAHELGHLFYATEHPSDYNDKDLNQKMANVFGVFTMFARGLFYDEKAPKMNRRPWMKMINDIKLLSNREVGKLNISE